MTYQIKVYKYSMEINKISDQKKIVVWLYSVVILLMIMIIVGGATRLTKLWSFYNTMGII